MVAALIVVGAGVLGFEVIMRLQTVITVVTGVLTVVYMVLAAGQIDWATVSALPSGSVEQVIGALVFLMTGFGLGWVNAAADYSRYLPRNASSGGVVGWTTFGASIAPVVLLVFGLLLAGSSPELVDRHRGGPGRRARLDAAADLVPRPVRARRGARPGRRGGAGHLLVRPRAARGSACASRGGPPRSSTA